VVGHFHLVVTVVDAVHVVVAVDVLVDDLHVVGQTQALIVVVLTCDQISLVDVAASVFNVEGERVLSHVFDWNLTSQRQRSQS